jgi:hypothetical protein
MSEIAPLIETLENRWMRAWVARDRKSLKELTSSRFRLVIGSSPSVLLDARSFLDAADGRFTCSAYRFGDVYARRHGSVAVFATQVEMSAELDGSDWSGRRWVSDLWIKGTVRRSWRLTERQFSALEERADVPAAIRKLQLWR